MKRKRAPIEKTPLKQTRISNFFIRGEPSTVKDIGFKEKGNGESPDVILCTPPLQKTSAKARKSLQSKLKSPQKNPQAMEVDIDSAFFENTSPSVTSSETLVKLSSQEKLPNVVSPSKPRKILQDIQSDNIIGPLEDLGFEDFSNFAWSCEKVIDSTPNFTLGFETCQKCVIVSSDMVGRERIVRLKAGSGSEMGRVVLRDMWAFCMDNMQAGDEVGVLAVMRGSDWVVDADHGYISLHPDILVSSTSLVGAMFCRRRGILANIFKGLDAENKIMTIGSLVHEMFQKALEAPSCSVETLEQIINDLMAVPSNLRSLYSCGISLEGTKNDLREFAPQIIKFLKIYVTKELQPERDNFRGTISDVVDIEENVSCLNLGVKGRIDVTVHVNVNGKKKRMPLELKTGRASFSNEHRTQVVLYVIVMSHLGHLTDSGLLMYLKEGILQEVKPTRAEIRDIILLRNDFIRYLRQFSPSNLPEPIRFVNACKNCPYSTVCTAYLDESVSQTHPIRSIAPSLDPKHLEYFLKWSKLLLLEDAEGNKGKLEMKLTGLVREEGCVKLGSDFKYSFKKGDRETGLSAGSFVQVSSEVGSRTYMGRIVQITPSRCSVLLDKELSEEGNFTVEGYQSSMLSRYMTNLGCLIEEQNESLRKIIIDGEPSIFSEKIPKTMLSPRSLEILGKLNEEQQRAVLKVLACENYILIEGPPGTGKTQTIAALIEMLLTLNQTVLLVAHSHSSVDNVLLRLTHVDFLRMGNLANIHPKLLDQSYARRSQAVKTVSEMENLFASPIIASTCLGLDNDIVAKKRFDVCIVDESSQVLQPEVLKPLFAARKFVLIGDPKQLRPVVKSLEARNEGMSESIFERLYKSGSSVLLTHQYRMNKVIMDLANNLTYGGVLKAGCEQVANGVLQADKENTTHASPWLAHVLSPLLQDAIVFVDTSYYLTQNPDLQFSCVNRVEANLVIKIVEEFLRSGVPRENIGVMAPFTAQIQILKDGVASNVEVNTIDQFQGRDKECIVFSCTKQDRGENEKGEYELLNDERRLTVAVTRAKHKLVIVGDTTTLRRYRTFQSFFKFLDVSKIVPLIEGENGFSWSELVA